MAALTGIILAGGQGRRMGGQDKGMVLFDGIPLYQHVLQRLRPQVDIVMISANRNHDRYQSGGFRVIPDTLPDFPGPLAGMLSGLLAAETEWVVFCSCDTPFVPTDYVEQLWRNKEKATAVWARSAERDHPVLALLHRSLAQPLAGYLQRGERRLMQFLREQGGHAVLMKQDEAAFRNLNTPEDLREEG
ncbi:molybdenum cofactor guanylyltransferase MobA [Candidatus Pantoea deserta]|uniref:Molybdenum cofactor guanylyltransferase n=1 Tax=Candidatus Pantoea deserta TaxID=1869313 RepID=A0A3N4NX27_9GAMM|nr:molybdenum cofactor guanylyltransferase MobA [Pantoea deserta]RPE00942.1 molybdenum cofactor guanylyltransferase MobA [Pantoea deserta]